MKYTIANRKKTTETITHKDDKGNIAGVVYRNWPVWKTDWKSALNGRRFDEPGMTVRFKYEMPNVRTGS